MKLKLIESVSRVLQAGQGGEAGRKEGIKWAVGGMATLLTGQKTAALGMFARGFAQLERGWREKHPEFQGDFKARVAESVRFYESTHQNGVNRQLHLIGIPMIVGGAIGLLATPSFSPPWLASAGAFTAGWALNIVGHAAFEKNAPAFADDPLSFIVGPLWDARQVVAGLTGKGKASDTGLAQAA